MVLFLRTAIFIGHCRTPRVRMGALRPVQVVSLLDTVVCSYYELCWWGLFVLMCGVYNITEILNIPSSIESIYFLRFHLACFSCFRTAQTTANNRHVFRVDKLPDHPPRFHIPRHFNPKSNRSLPETSFLYFGWNSKFRDQEVSKEGSTSDMPSGRTDQALFHWKVWMIPVFECSGYVEDKKVRKKDKKDHRNFFIFIDFVMLVSPVVRFERFIPFWTFLFSSFFFLQKTWKYDKTHFEKVNPTNCW